MDEFSKPSLSTRAQRYFNKVKDLIHYCSYDQSYDGSEVIWLWGEKIELTDLFEQYEIPEKYWSDIAANLVCKGCGFDGFEVYSEVGLIDRIDKEINEKLKEANRIHKKEISELQDFITNYPSLVLENKLAKKISAEIKNKRLPIIKLKDFECYRCRLVNSHNVFGTEDLGAPRIGISNTGRYNHAGQSVLYVSNELSCAIREILEDYNTKALIWTQQYKIEEADNILDLTTDWEGYLKLSILFTAIINNDILEQKISDYNSTWKPEYLLTNFVSDCAKKAGYNGIKYSSSKGWGYNIVLFDPSKITHSPIGNPKVVIHEPENNDPIIDI